jgi:hypothetical protein
MEQYGFSKIRGDTNLKVTTTKIPLLVQQKDHQILVKLVNGLPLTYFNNTRKRNRNEVAMFNIFNREIVNI